MKCLTDLEHAMECFCFWKFNKIVEKLRRVTVGFTPCSRYNNGIEGNCEGAEKV